MKNGVYYSQIINNQPHFQHKPQSSVYTGFGFSLSNTDFNFDSGNSKWQSYVKEIENMASRDRTQEFARIIRSQQGNLVNGAFHYREGKKPKDFRQYAEFMQRAK